MTKTAYAHRLPAPSGNRDNDYWQAKCDTCPWTSTGMYPNRTTEGRRLAQRDADAHNQVAHS